jgi:hypothetical protein
MVRQSGVVGLAFVVARCSAFPVILVMLLAHGQALKFRTITFAPFPNFYRTVFICWLMRELANGNWA